MRFYPIILICSLLSLIQSMELADIAKLPGVISEGIDSSEEELIQRDPLTYSAERVCDKFSSNITYENPETVKDNFDIEFEFYVGLNPTNDSNYYVDYILKNPHYDINSFYLLNISDNINEFHPIYISNQGVKGYEIRFNIAKTQLCTLLYQFHFYYGLRNSVYDETSHKIFLTGSCDISQSYFSSEYNELIAQGFRCVDYNSGYATKNEAWCYYGYQDDQCCSTYSRDLFFSDTCATSGLSSTENATTLITSTTLGSRSGWITTAL